MKRSQQVLASMAAECVARWGTAMPPLVEGREETAKRGKREPDRGDSSSWRAEVATRVLMERCIRVRRAGGGVAKFAWKMNLEAMDCKEEFLMVLPN